MHPSMATKLGWQWKQQKTVPLSRTALWEQEGQCRAEARERQRDHRDTLLGSDCH